MAQRQKVPPGSATAKAIDYTLGRRVALTRYIDDGDMSADNNWAENQIQPFAGRTANGVREGKMAVARAYGA